LDYQLGAVGHRETLANLEYAFKRFREIGVSVPARSRLIKAKELLEQMVAKSIDVRKSVKLRRDLAEAQRVAMEFHELARAINPRARPASPRLRNDLQRAYGGELNPAAQDHVSVAARNLQFQLWLASWFAAGERPLLYEEPDLKVTYWFRWYGVAAKRAQKPSTIIRNVIAAAQQVKKRIGHGFVALTVDNYSPAFTKRFAGLRNSERFFNRVPELAAAATWCENSAPWIHAILVFGAHARWRLQLKPPLLELAFPELLIRLARDKCDHAHLAEFFQEIQQYRKARLGGIEPPSRDE